jgi:SET and MYND domain-containing protein
VCGALSRLLLASSSSTSRCLDLDAQTQARFLVAAYNLAIVSPHSFQQLLLLEGEATMAVADGERLHALHAFMEDVVRWARVECPTLPSWPLELLSLLLAKDQRNSFGFSVVIPGSGERRVRAYATYAQASFINHDCLPTACRYVLPDMMRQ